MRFRTSASASEGASLGPGRFRHLALGLRKASCSRHAETPARQLGLRLLRFWCKEDKEWEGKEHIELSRFSIYEMLARQATKTQSKAVDVVVSM